MLRRQLGSAGAVAVVLVAATGCRAPAPALMASQVLATHMRPGPPLVIGVVDQDPLG